MTYGSISSGLAIILGVEEGGNTPDTGWWGEGRLLYVACTRALHRLSLFSVGKGEDA